MFTLFDWGFRLAILLPWASLVAGVVTLLVPSPQTRATTAIGRAAA